MPDGTASDGTQDGTQEVTITDSCAQRIKELREMEGNPALMLNNAEWLDNLNYLEFLRDIGEIEDALFFQGGGRFFTVWNPARPYEMGPEMAMPKAACRALEKDAREKGKKK